MKTIKTILSKTSYITLSLVVGLTLAAGVTFAAYEWSTSWITTGGTISAVELKNNLDYLEARAGKLPTDCSTVGDTLIWNGTSFDCGAGGGGSSFLTDNGHTSADCTTDGGTEYDTGLGYSICKFTGSSCVSGWLQKDSWSETTGRTCSANYCTSCYTGQHAFDNRSRETCGYTTPNEEQQCTGSATCNASVTKVGCY